MIKKLKRSFLNLRIEVKTILSMVGISLVVAGAVGLLCSFFFTDQFKELSERQSQDTMNVSLHTMENQVNTLYRNMIYMLSEPVFKEIYHCAKKGEADPNFIPNYIKVSGAFSSFIYSNEAVDNLVILCGNGQLYSTFDVGLNYSLADFPEETAQTRITWLSSQENPLHGTSGDVVPVCFPISYTYSLSFSDGDSFTMMLVMYLNADRLAMSMERTNRTAFSNMYLTNGQGMPLTVKKSHPLYRMFADPAFQAHLSRSEAASFEEKGPDHKSYGIATAPLGISGLRLVNVVSYDPLLAGVRNIQRMAVLAVVLSSICALLIAKGLSASLTTPIKALLEQVGKVRAGRYDLALVTKYQDEMRTLDEALCDMGDTIRRQMEDIRQTEKKRLDAEMAALSEQINPHFLYNTLECIHWETLVGNTDTAANMLESLGTFLRLSLNQGQALLSLPQSLRHTQQYIQIMGHRFSSNIHFSYSIPAPFAGLMLPRMVLQPLAENAILHGFGIQGTDMGIADPTIRVQVSREGAFIHLTMSDNGKGFDVKQTRQCMAAENTGHVGLNNVHSRLVHCFGADTRIALSSVPYYQNTVTLILPITAAEGLSEDPGSEERADPRTP